MPIPEAEIVSLKASVDLAALVRSRGITLTPKGKDLMGLCPFHSERTASFSVTPSTNLFHCFGCDAAGDAFNFLMKLDGIDFPEAVRRLSGTPHNGTQSHGSQSAPDITTPENQNLLRSILAAYTENLKRSKEAQDYLKSRGLFSALLIESGAGFSNGKLETATKDLEKLCAIGILRKTDSSFIERFTGSLVFPATENGKITQIYGRRITESQVEHMLLPLKHRGFFNENALSYSEIILCESAIDTFSLLIHGRTNVCGIFGANGLNESHVKILRTRGVQKVYLAYDNDPAGNRGASDGAELLQESGIFAYRILFPENTDANDFIHTNTDPRARIGELIKEAAFIEPENAPAPAKKKSPQKNQESPGELTFDSTIGQFARGERKYRIYGLARGTAGSLPVSVSLSHQGHFFMDKLELCSAKERDRFLDRITAQFELEREILESDVNQLLYTLIRHKEEEQRNAQQPQSTEYQMPDAERAEAEELLKSPQLIDRITSDFEASGIAGEKTNLLCGYIAATSRLLSVPLHVLFHSSSAAGKSTVMNAILSFMPDEVVIQYSALTGQALFYMQSKDLKHKILALAEDEGAQRARYIIKMLQTEGKASIASTIKDPETGKLIAEEYRIEGPLSVFSTSTALFIDEELLNRNLVLAADESIEQTERIFETQRQFETEEALELTETRDKIRRIHKNAQRLLKPIRVINPFARDTKFPSGRSRLRRDHGKFLALIRTITLLHQFQREKKVRNTPSGKEEYIEVSKEDLELAKKIAWPVFTRTLDEMPPHTRTFLQLITGLRDSEAKTNQIAAHLVRLTRRQMMEATGLSATQTFHHLSKLMELEYIMQHGMGPGKPVRYEVCDSTLPEFFGEEVSE